MSDHTSFRHSRATPEDFAIGASVAAGILALLFGFVTFSEEIILAVY